MKKHDISIEAVIVAIVLIAMLTLVFLGVLSRYVLHFSFSFTEELVCAMFVLLSTMGGALASKEDGHYTLDLITGMMKPRLKKLFYIIDTALTWSGGGSASVYRYHNGGQSVQDRVRLRGTEGSQLGVRLLRTSGSGVLF